MNYTNRAYCMARRISGVPQRKTARPGGGPPERSAEKVGLDKEIDSCIGTPSEALSTRCGGQGLVIFYGMAKPVRAPQIGPARPY